MLCQLKRRHLLSRNTKIKEKITCKIQAKKAQSLINLNFKNYCPKNNQNLMKLALIRISLFKMKNKNKFLKALSKIVQKRLKKMHLCMFLTLLNKNLWQTNLSKRTSRFNGLRSMFQCMEILIWRIIQVDWVIYKKVTFLIYKQKIKWAI
jgi:hypothetical protein